MGKYLTCADWDNIDPVKTPDDYKVLTKLLIPGNLYALMNKPLQFEPDPDTTHPWRKPENQRVSYADIFGVV